jgi:hypothetical protein
VAYQSGRRNYPLGQQMLDAPATGRLLPCEVAFVFGRKWINAHVRFGSSATANLAIFRN